MHEPNVQEILRRLPDDALVLDVGGWACPFNRAQWVLDAQPYATRGFYRTFGGAPSQGPEREWFTRETWVQRDVCDRDPWPFADKQFDFAVCSHTLEDLRDPIGVCRELVRAAKAGYLEVPTRVFESTVGRERPGMAGLAHHRWLCEIADGAITFIPKYGTIHAEPRFHLPKRVADAEPGAQWLWWEGSFGFREVEHHGVAAQEAELERFVRERHSYSAARRAWWRTKTFLRFLPVRVRDKVRRLRD